MSAFMLIRHKVKDFNTWKVGYDGHRDAFRGGPLRSVLPKSGAQVRRRNPKAKGGWNGGQVLCGPSPYMS